MILLCVSALRFAYQFASSVRIALRIVLRASSPAYCFEVRSSSAPSPGHVLPLARPRLAPRLPPRPATSCPHVLPLARLLDRSFLAQSKVMKKIGKVGFELGFESTLCIFIKDVFSRCVMGSPYPAHRNINPLEHGWRERSKTA